MMRANGMEEHSSALLSIWCGIVDSIGDAMHPHASTIQCSELKGAHSRVKGEGDVMNSSYEARQEGIDFGWSKSGPARPAVDEHEDKHTRNNET